MKRGFLVRTPSSDEATGSAAGGTNAAAAAGGEAGVAHRTVQLVQLERPKRPSAAEVAHAHGDVVLRPHVPHAHPTHVHPHAPSGQQATATQHTEPLNRTQGRLRQKLNERQAEERARQPQPSHTHAHPHVHHHAHGPPTASHGGFGAAVDIPIDLRRVQETKWTQPSLDRGFRPSLPSVDRKASDPSAGDHGHAHGTHPPPMAIPRPLVLMAPPKMSGISTTGFKVSWTAPIDPPAPVSLYQLEMDSGSGTFVRQYEGTALSTEIAGLRPGKTYRVRVLAICEGDNTSKHSQVVSATTLPTAPSTPEPPKLSGRTKNTLTLKWAAPADNGSPITSYKLEWDEGCEEARFIPEYEGTAITHKIMGAHIRSGHRYAFRLAAENALGWSPFCDPVSYFTSATVPATPDAPVLVASSTDSLAVRWNTPADNGSPITEFRVEMSRPDEGYGFRAAYSGDKTEFCAKGLKRNAEYAFRVIAINGQGESKCSAVATFTTRAAVPGPPQPPRTVGAPQPNEVSVAWDAPKDDGGVEITASRLEVDRGDGFRVEYEGPLRAHIVRSLEPGTTYLLRVQCANESGFGAFSAELKTRTAAVPPAPPQALSASSIKARPDALAVKWDAPAYNGGAQVTSYVLEIAEGADTAFRGAYTGAATAATIDALHPGRQYRLRCAAVNAAGRGQFSSEASARTAASAPGAPGAPSVTCTATTAALSWVAPDDNGSPITEYRVEMAAPGAPPKHLSAGTATSLEVKGLLPAAEYRFAVQALSSAGAGALSPQSTATTQAAAPASPVSLSVASVSATGACVTWSPPRDNGAPVVTYRVEVVAADGVAHVTEVPALQCFADIAGLRADEPCRVRVQAANRLGTGPYSAFVSFHTALLPPGQPSLEDGGATHNSVKLRWAAPKGLGADADVEYVLEMRAHAAKPQPFAEVYRGPLRQFKATKLRASTRYVFRVRAINPAGEGPWSAEVASDTQSEPLPQLAMPRAKGASIVWTAAPQSSAVAAKGGDTVRYELQRQRLAVEEDFVTVYSGQDLSWVAADTVGAIAYRVRLLVGDAAGPFSAVLRCGQVEAPAPVKDASGQNGSGAKAEGKPDARRQKKAEEVPAAESSEATDAAHARAHVLQIVLPVALVCASLALSLAQLALST